MFLRNVPPDRNYLMLRPGQETAVAWASCAAVQGQGAAVRLPHRIRGMKLVAGVALTS
jgi:hypothetical protein